jgi:ABC-type glycerol-3-phosphate transport system substrate-binding protein
MKAIRILAVAAGLATLAACGSGKEANNASDNALTEGIEINSDAVNADINATDLNAADTNAENTVDVNAANATDANAVTNNAQ